MTVAKVCRFCLQERTKAPRAFAISPTAGHSATLYASAETNLSYAPVQGWFLRKRPGGIPFARRNATLMYSTESKPVRLAI
ncbi:hypothetical protein Poly59_07670 [Rubripirellula reticaptiva]|uniref:Uncharacterized protein n=1 Tax=Rubripirellula reticaptiva TaxID=2528013 RepID=A0A5C6F8Z0_9BACT|nr:hypothetical protein Poly59_07670 [Rubripirellula reticaptiva]